uniref:HTH_Tnp_Tc3_1 domain-containing protein n=1 Tax=Heterorhabditis bacteriophora TaxID=37862 RepID=A0A1I7XDH9_HETBA
MRHAPKLSQHERGQIKALSTAGFKVKRIADVLKRSRRPIMNFLRLQEEFGTNKTSNSATSIVGIPRSCGIDVSESAVWRMLDKCLNMVRPWMKKCP